MSSLSLPRSLALYESARRVIPGGVTSAVRAGALPHPLFVERAEGAWLWDADGNRYVDFVMGYGPLLLGHAPAIIRDALARQAALGTTFGSQHRGEVQLADLLTEIVPGAERVIFSTTGSEGVASALRVARAATGRPLVLKFEGHYHGWLDGVFSSVGYQPERSGPRERPNVVPQSDGMAPGSLLDLLVAPWNDLAATRAILEEHRGRVAAVILEPVLVNGGVIAPEDGFLAGLRELASAHGSVLIFDEVITGFRLALGGAQEWSGVTADLAVFAKALAAGVAISAVTGGANLLDRVAGRGVVHNGTFNGNGLGVAAAIAAVTHLRAYRDDVYPRLEALAAHLAAGLASASPRLTVRRAGPIVHTAVGEPAHVRDIRDRSGDPAAHARFVEALLAHGVHTTPRGLWYLSTAHSEADIDAAVEAAMRAAAVLDA